MNFLKDLLTEDDNKTWCAARVCSVASVFGFLLIAFFHVLHGGIDDFEKLGMGLAATLGGSGVMIGAKAATQKADDVSSTNP
jgi:hypothetical protein